MFTDPRHDVLWADTLGCGAGEALAPGREACLVAARGELEQAHCRRLLSALEPLTMPHECAAAGGAVFVIEGWPWAASR